MRANNQSELSSNSSARPVPPNLSTKPATVLDSLGRDVTRLSSRHALTSTHTSHVQAILRDPLDKV